MGLVAVALAARLGGGSGWWLNPDEGIYFDILTAPTLSGFWEGVRWNAHPPLYYVLLRGIGVLGGDFTWYRVPALVGGCAAVLGLWLCGLEVDGRGWRGTLTGTLAGLVVALSPFAVESSWIIRPYMALLALLVFALYLLLRHLRTPGRSTLVGYVACVSLALLTHYSALLALAVFCCVVAEALVSHRVAGPEARRLVVAHAAPLAIAGLLFVVHLRPLMASNLATNALMGWLDPYMPAAPPELWRGTVGFFAMLGGTRLALPLVVLFVGGLAWACRERSWTLVILGGAALVIAIVLSAAGKYPLGGARHVTWLVPFTLLPAASWAAWGLTAAAPARRATAPALLLLLATGGPLGRALGTDAIASPQEERVLRRADLGRLLGPLAELPPSEPVLMTGQAYYLLLPLFEAERRTAVYADDGSFFHFRWLDRDVVVSASWDLRVRPGEVEASNHLRRLLASVDAARPDLALTARDEVLVLFGGWPPTASTGDVGALRSFETVVHGGWVVPGLELLAADLGEYARIISVSGGLPGLP